MRVLVHILVDVPSEDSFGLAAKAAADRLTRGTNKVVVEAVSIETARTFSEDLIKRVQEAISVEVNETVQEDQAKRIASALDFGDEMTAIDFYNAYPDDQEY